MNPSTGSFAIDGRRLSFIDFGNVGLPPAVFLHGTGLHAWIWRAYAELLTDRFHCYALDLRGHGDSTKEAGDYRWPSMAGDLVAFLKELKIKKPLCVGHSMGGAVTLLAGGLHPGTLGAMVLIDPIILPEKFYEIPATLETQPMAAKSIKRRPIWDSREQMIEAYENKLPFKTWRRDQFLDYVNYGTEILPDGKAKLKCPPEIEAKCYMGSQAMNPWPLLPKINIPTLILRGTESNTVGLVDSAGVTRSMPNARFIEIPGATHFVPMEQPELIAREILEFSEEVGVPNEDPGRC